MSKNIIKLLAILLITFMLVSCTKPNDLEALGSKAYELTEKEKEYNDYVNEKSVIYSKLSLEDKKDYYNKIFYLFKSPNSTVRTEMFSRTWANLRYITDKDSDMIDFLLEKVLGNEGIFYNIGSENTNDVLLRTYSLKVIASLINRSNSIEAIDQSDLVKIKEKLIEYIYLEKDRRGYVEYIGDVYTLTNWLDAIDSIINVMELTKQDKEELINVIKDQIISTSTSFNGGEDIRLAAVLSKLIVNAKDTVALEKFIDDIGKDLKDIYKNDREHYVYVRSNILIFMKSLYYRTDIMVGVNKEQIKEIIIDYISSINHRVYI